MKGFLNTLATLLLISTLAGCASSTETDNPGGGNNNVTVAKGKVTWQIGGETKLASGLALRNGNNTPPYVSIVGQWDGTGPMYQANLTIYNTAPATGTFDIIPGTPAEIGKASATMNHNGISRVALPGTGSIRVTKLEGNNIQGTFTFKTMNAVNFTDTLEVTGGQFNLDFLI